LEHGIAGAQVDEGALHTQFIPPKIPFEFVENRGMISDTRLRKEFNMKKPIETKKVFVAVLILTMALFIFPLSSFGGKGRGCEVRNEGNIEDLYFYFGDGLQLSLPGLGEVTVLEVEVFASGREMTVVTPSKQYVYHASLWEGWDDSDHGIIRASTLELPYDLWFEFDSATLFEHFKIKKRQIDAACEGEEVTVPKKVDLLFEVKNVILLDGDGNPFPGFEPFNLTLTIIDGKPVIIDVW
jgi:hypothetical protein